MSNSKMEWDDITRNNFIDGNSIDISPKGTTSSSSSTDPMPKTSLGKPYRVYIVGDIKKHGTDER